MKKLYKIICLVIILLIIGTNLSHAGVNFVETQIDIDNIELYKQDGEININVFSIFVILYIIIQIILLKKYGKIKFAIEINLIVFMIIIMNTILIPLKIHVLLNPIILIIGCINHIIMLKNNYEKIYKIMKVVLMLVIVSFIIWGICFKTVPKMKIVKAECAFGNVLDKNEYYLELKNGEEIKEFNAEVLKIDEQGVLVEYIRKYYIKTGDDAGIIENYTSATELVQQKLLWDVNYIYEEEKDPMICVDGGYDYYIRIEK